MLPRNGRLTVLRRLRPADLPDFQAYRRDPDVGRYQGWVAQSDEDAARFIADMAHAPLFVPGEWIQLAIAEPVGDRLIGDVGLCLATDGRQAEIGFTLDPRHQGRGLAGDAVRAAIDLVFAATTALAVVGITDARNTPSARLMQRVGLRHAGRAEAVFRGEACVEDTYRIERPGA